MSAFAVAIVASVVSFIGALVAIGAIASAAGNSISELRSVKRELVKAESRLPCPAHMEYSDSAGGSKTYWCARLGHHAGSHQALNSNGQVVLEWQR